EPSNTKYPFTVAGFPPCIRILQVPFVPLSVKLFLWAGVIVSILTGLSVSPTVCAFIEVRNKTAINVKSVLIMI
ncbi:MAG TPA: hypothetical protein VL832_19950, partial [Puia sp.]|nr:hypothetical protein [Puia sp.]